MFSSKKALLLILIFWIGSVIVIFGFIALHQMRKQSVENERDDRIGQMADEIREGSNTFLVDADSFPVSGEEDEYIGSFAEGSGGAEDPEGTGPETSSVFSSPPSTASSISMASAGSAALTSGGSGIGSSSSGAFSSERTGSSGGAGSPGPGSSWPFLLFLPAMRVPIDSPRMSPRRRPIPPIISPDEPSREIFLLTAAVYFSDWDVSMVETMNSPPLSITGVTEKG